MAVPVPLAHPPSRRTAGKIWNGGVEMLCWAPVGYFLAVAVAMTAVEAIRDGRIQTRRRFFYRNQQPFGFWFLVFFILSGALFLAVLITLAATRAILDARALHGK